MSKKPFDPRHHGVALDKEDFADACVVHFNSWNPGGPRVAFDEMLLKPRQALEFCHHVRYQYSGTWSEIQDEHILRAIMQRRKSPKPGRPMPTVFKGKK